MPYIKKEERPPYDNLIANIFQSEQGFSSDYAQELIKMLNSIEQEKQDGHLNYFLTKVLLITNGLHAVMNPIFLRQFTLQVLIEVYQPKYFNYNRAIGVLNCIGLEYQRRHGVRASFLVRAFLNGLIGEFYLIVGNYEDKKIAENGDVE